MKTLTLATVAGLLLVPAAASAQQTTPAPGAAPATTAGQAAPAAAGAPVGPSVGATVYDTSGAVVGTIDSMTPTVAVISTGTNKVGIPLTSVGKGTNGPVIAMTKAQLDGAAQQQKDQGASQLKAALVPGATVNGAQGASLGATVKTVDSQYVTLKTAKGDVRLPIGGFALSPGGGLMVGLTADQFATAVSGAAPTKGAAAQ